jgi:flagellin-specific chaperone FliS
LEINQENLTLRKQLSSSLNQTAEFSAKCDHLETKLTELSSLLSYEKNRFYRLKEVYRQCKEELRLLREEGRQDHHKIQELNRLVEQLRYNYEQVLDHLYAENLKK